MKFKDIDGLSTDDIDELYENIVEFGNKMRIAGFKCQNGNFTGVYGSSYCNDCQNWCRARSSWCYAINGDHYWEDVNYFSAC